MSSLSVLSRRIDWRQCSSGLIQNRSVTIGIVGGSGFLGTHTAMTLVESGYHVRILSRRPQRVQKRASDEDISIEQGFNRAQDLRFRQRGVRHFLKKNLSKVGESPLHDDAKTKLHMELHTVNVTSKSGAKDLRMSLSGCDGVINLVGILAEGRRRGQFDDVHHKSAANVATVCKEVGVKRLIHVSAIGASTESNARYAQSKARGEEAVMREFPAATILRPSIVVGRGDGFFSLFDKMTTVSPFLPLVGGGNTKFQPVHIDDFVEACVSVFTTGSTQGNVYELGGPDVYTFRELLQMMLVVMKRKRLLLPIPRPIAHPLALVLQNLPGKRLTVDQVRMLQHDNVVSPSAKTFSDLNMNDPLTVEEALDDIFTYRRHA